MEDQHFEDAVLVLTGPKRNGSRYISSTAQAARMLLDDAWPVKGGKKHRAARKACMEVLAGQRQAAAARKAFAEAAAEADILVAKGMLTRHKIR